MICDNWYVFVDVFYQWYHTKSCIYIYISYICICIIVLFMLQIYVHFLISWPDDGPSFITGPFKRPTFQVTSLGAQSRPWPRRSRDRRRSKRPRVSKTVKAPRLPVIEQLGTEIHPRGPVLYPPKLLTWILYPKILRNRTWSHGGLVQMIFRTSRGIFSGSMLLFRGVSKNGRMCLKPEIRCFTSFYSLHHFVVSIFLLISFV